MALQRWQAITWTKADPVQLRIYFILPQIARFMGPTWGPFGAVRTQVGPMLYSDESAQAILYHFPGLQTSLHPPTPHSTNLRSSGCYPLGEKLLWNRSIAPTVLPWWCQYLPRADIGNAHSWATTHLNDLKNDSYFTGNTPPSGNNYQYRFVIIYGWS